MKFQNYFSIVLESNTTFKEVPYKDGIIKRFDYRKNKEVFLIRYYLGHKDEYKYELNLHRLDGPAVEWTEGDHKAQYFINGEQYSREDYNKHPLVVLYNKLNNKNDIKVASDLLDL
jgi:hypothetical protein